jgi:hypothetical protein
MKTLGYIKVDGDEGPFGTPAAPSTFDNMDREAMCL